MPYKNASDERARESRRKHYRNNKNQYYERNAKRKIEMREYLNSVKAVPCMDCGKEYPPYVMDFDHRDPLEKSYTVTNMVNIGSWKKMFEEIQKCDIVCANCHRERTWNKTNI